MNPIRTLRRPLPVLSLNRPPFERLPDWERYFRLIRAIAPANLIGYWPLWEPPGATVAVDYSGRGNHGAYTAVTLGQPGIGDGRTAASFDGSTSFCNLYSAGLAADFNGAEGTLVLWVKAANAGVWTDSTIRYMAYLATLGGANHVEIRKTGSANQFAVGRLDSGANVRVFVTESDTGWLHLALTWSVSGNILRVYRNGAQVGGDQTGLNAWSGAIVDTRVNLGAITTTPANVWSGDLAHAALYNIAMIQPQIAAMATV